MIVLGGTVDLSPPANVVSFGGTAGTFASGRPEVNASHIAGSAVSTSSAQIGVNVVNAGGTAWGSGAITAASIASGAITSAKFASGAIDATAIAADAIGASEIATDAIGAAELAADAIGASEVATGAVDTTALASGAITSSAFASGAITAAAIASDAIGAAEIADGALDNATFACTGGSFLILGVVDCGTAQSASSTGLVGRSALAMGDDTANGMTLLAQGSTQGYAQSRSATDFVGSTDAFTVDTWSVTPSGTISYYLFGTSPSTGGGGLDAAGVRSAIGLASANLDTQLGTIDSNVDAILVDTGTTLDDLVDDLESRLGTPSNLGGGATVAANLSDIEGQTDDIGAAGAGLTAVDDAIMTRVGAPVGASISADIAAVKTDSAAILVDTSTTLDDMVDDLETRLTATRAGYLDNLSAGAVATAAALTTVDGVVDTIQVTTDKLDDTLELDSTVYRFTANALETAPTGSGESLDAIADAVWDELLSGHAVSGSTGEALSSASAGGGLDAAGVRAAIGLATANLDTQLADIPTVSEFNARTVTSATYATATALQTVDDNVDAILVDTGTTLQGELDGIQADTEDLQTQIGVAGAGLTAADDAVMTRLGSPAGASVSADVASVKSDSAAILVDTAEIGTAGAGLTAVDDAVLAAIEQTARADAAIINCEVNTANFAGSTTTVACLLTDRDGGAITAASGDLEGKELLILSGAQIYEGRFINDTTWDAANSELRLTLSRALPGTLADAVTAVVR
jgi:hypothetical protein